MGREVSPAVFSREDRQRYRQKVRACLDVFARMLREARFEEERRSVGLEIELNLTDRRGERSVVRPMRSQATAHYYSGPTAKRQVVEVWATAAGLEFRDESGTAHRWPYETIPFPGAIGARDPLRFADGPPPHATLVVHDP